jgi:hypothetical protein
MNTINRPPITKARIYLGQIANRAHYGNEHFILEKDGIPVTGIIGAHELADYLAMRDPKVKASIAASRRDHSTGKTLSPGELPAELNRRGVSETAS